jgi:hypothetical protein
MPLGISESAIKAAYGPIDLSGLYKGIEAFAKKSEYNDKLERQALQKEYYTSLATLNKNRDKMNPNDSTDFMYHYNKYKSAQQRLIANPRLIDKNPDEYGKLSSESNEAYENASKLANASIAMQGKISKIYDWAKNNDKKIIDGGLEKISSLSNMKTQDIINQGLDDLDKYLYQGPDLEKFNKELKNIEDNKDNKIKARINEWEDSNIGASVYNLYNILDPVKVSNDVNRTLALQQNPSKAASVLLEKFGDQVDQVKSDYNKLKDEDFAKFKTPEGTDLFPIHHPYNDPTRPQTRKPDLNFDASTPQAKLAAFLTARPIITSVVSPQEEGTGNYTEFDKGKIGEKDLVKKYALELQKTLANMRQNLALAKISQQFANRKALKEVDKTADAKFKVMLNVIGSAYKTDISRGIKNLDSPTIGDLETVLNQVANDMKPAKKKLY